MQKRVISEKLIELSAEEGKLLHRIGSEDYSRIARIVTATEGADDWEEISPDDIPAFTTAEYEAKVEQLIRERFSVSAELAILRQRDTKPEEFAAYDAFAEECKERAKRELESPSPSLPAGEGD